MNEQSLSDRISAVVIQAVNEELKNWDLSLVKLKEVVSERTADNQDETTASPEVAQQGDITTNHVIVQEPSGSGTSFEVEKQPETKPKPLPGSLDDLLAGII